MRDIHVVYTDYAEFGWGISSPQIPNLTGGRKSFDEAVDDTIGLLAWCGYAPGTYRLVRHEEVYRLASDGEEFLVRWAEDGAEERHATGQRLIYQIDTNQPLGDQARMPRLVTGEHLIVCVLADDTFGSVLDQLAPGQGVYLQFHQGDDVMYGIPVYDSDVEAGRGTTNMEKLGITRTTPVSEVIERILANEAQGLRLAIHQTQ